MREGWVAYRLAVLGADKRGVVRSGLVVRDHATRAALLVDLALRGRLSFGAEENDIDTSPTGYPPVDRLVRYVVENPTQSMADLIGTAPVTVLDVFDRDQVVKSRFGRARCVQVDPADGERERQLVQLAADTGEADSSATAALAVLAGALEFAGSGNRPELLEQCGAARALVSDCAAYLDQLLVKLALVRQIPSSGF
jgi:hypothetical protein